MDVLLGDATRNIDRYKRESNVPASVISAYGGDAAAFQSSQGSQLVLIAVALLVIAVVLVAVVAVWLRAPFLVVVLLAAVVAAGLRALGMH